jgi:hypothetical protein
MEIRQLEQKLLHGNQCVYGRQQTDNLIRPQFFGVLFLIRRATISTDKTNSKADKGQP